MMNMSPSYGRYMVFAVVMTVAHRVQNSLEWRKSRRSLQPLSHESNNKKTLIKIFKSSVALHLVLSLQDILQIIFCHDLLIKLPKSKWFSLKLSLFYIHTSLGVMYWTPWSWRGIWFTAKNPHSLTTIALISEQLRNYYYEYFLQAHG